MKYNVLHSQSQTQQIATDLEEDAVVNHGHVAVQQVGANHTVTVQIYLHLDTKHWIMRKLHQKRAKTKHKNIFFTPLSGPLFS